MKARQIKLLNYLIHYPNQYLSIQTLQSVLGCSEKTVRNDLDALTLSIADFSGIKILRKRGLGILLSGQNNALSMLYQKINHIPKVSDNERLIEVAYQLLTTSEPISLKKFENKFYTHTGVIKKDLQKINVWLKQFKLIITSKQGKGTSISGNELNKRNAIAHLSELVHHESLDVLDFFEPAEYRLVKHIAQQIQTKYQLTLTDGGFDSLILHALVLMKRTRQKHAIKMPETQSQAAKQSEAYFIAADFLSRLKAKINLQFPENEVVYFSWHISSSIRKNIGGQAPYHKDNAQVRAITDFLIDKVSYYTQMPFSRDASLEDSIYIHMASVLKRLHFGFHISNPMLHEIKKLYPYMMSMIIFALRDLKLEKELYVPEAEAAFLVLHFQAAVERMEHQSQNKRALVICHLGIGMSRLLEAKLNQQYKNITIVACLSKHEFETRQAEFTDIDFIITTVALSHTKKTQIEISPLLTTIDKRKLNQFLQAKADFSKLENYDQLKNLVKDGLFQKAVNLTHPFEIIERLSTQLVRLDFIDSQFTHQALLRERSSSTAIGGKIAIPHAPPHLVHQTTVSIGVLKQPIIWGNEQVSLVFLLAISEADRHLTRRLLKELSYLSQNPIIVEKLIACQTKTDFLSQLN